MSSSRETPCIYSRSQWPCGLRRRSTAARLLRSLVRSPLVAWMFVCCECCVLSFRGLCDGLITRPGSPTDCGASLCVIKKPRTRGGYSPLEGCKIQTHYGLWRQKKKIYIHTHTHTHTHINSKPTSQKYIPSLLK